MKHKFLFEPKLWKAKGYYIDDKGRMISVKGRSEVQHKGGKWILKSEIFVPLKGGRSLDLQNIYSIKPLKGKKTETDWTSENKLTGKFFGRLFLAGDTFISTYATKDGKYTGYETVKHLGGGKYENAGSFYYSGERMSSWKVTLF